MFRKSLTVVGFGLTLAMLQACGAQNASNGSLAGTAAATTAAATQSTGSTAAGPVANFDAVLKSSDTAAYISLADTNDICQDQVQAITTLTNQLQQSLANGGDVQSAISQFNTALQALASCVTSQSGANLPSIPQVDPKATTGSNSCSVSSINGQVTQTGDCSNCQVVHMGNNVSANCSSGGAAGDANVTFPSIDPNFSVPSIDPNVFSAGGSTINSNGCSVSVVNGTPTMSGDCSNCQVQHNGNSVSVSCNSTN